MLTHKAWICLGYDGRSGIRKDRWKHETGPMLACSSLLDLGSQHDQGDHDEPGRQGVYARPADLSAMKCPRFRSERLACRSRRSPLTSSTRLGFLSQQTQYKGKRYFRRLQPGPPASGMSLLANGQKDVGLCRNRISLPISQLGEGWLQTP